MKMCNKVVKPLIMAVFIVLLVLQSGDLKGGVYAEDAQQSEDEISMELEHEHAKDTCYETKWVHCGGAFYTYFEPYYGAECYSCYNSDCPLLNGGSWIAVGERYGYHSGEYVSTLTCDIGVTGELCISKTENQGSACLQAFLRNETKEMQNCSVSWEDGSGDTLRITHNGYYTASANWVDSITGEERSEKLTYCDISFPIEVIYMDEQNVIDTREVMYGGGYEDMDVPVKTGYNFKGYTCNEAEIYDEYGISNKNLQVKTMDAQVELTAKWQPKTYTIYYGEDVNEDGIPDNSMVVTYGMEYPPIEVPEGTFNGYYIGRNRIYDKDGMPTDVWKWDISDELIIMKTSCPGKNDSSRDSDEDRGVSDNAVADNNTASISADDNSSGQEEQKAFGDELTDCENSNKQNEAAETTHIKTASANIVKSEYNNIAPKLPPLHEADDNAALDSADNEFISEDIHISESPGNTIKYTHRDRVIKNVLTVAVITAAATTGTSIIWLVVWIILIMYASCEVYALDDNGRKHRLGRIAILRHKGIYRISISDRMCNKCKTGRYKLVVEEDFLIKNANLPVLIKVGKCELREALQHVVCISEV